MIRAIALALLLLAPAAQAIMIDTSVDSRQLAVQVLIWNDQNQTQIAEATIPIDWRFAINSSLDTEGGPGTYEIVALEHPTTNWETVQLEMPDRYRLGELVESEIEFTFRWRFLPGTLEPLELTDAERLEYMMNYFGFYPTFSPMYGELELHKSSSLGSVSFVPGWRLQIWARQQVLCTPPICTAEVVAGSIWPIALDAFPPYYGNVAVGAVQAAQAAPAGGQVPEASAALLLLGALLAVGRRTRRARAEGEQA